MKSIDFSSGQIVQSGTLANPYSNDIFGIVSSC